MGTMERRERERENRRRAILEAAERLFFERGFTATRMEDIAARAEISVGALYRYFQDKEEIYATLAVEGLKTLEEIQEKKARGIRDYFQAARAFGHGYLEFYRDYPGYFDVLSFLDYRSRFMNLPPRLAEELSSRFLSSLRKLRDLVQGAQEEGLVEAMDPMQVAVLLWALLEGLISLQKRGYLQGLGLDLKDTVERGMDVMRRGLQDGGKSLHAPSGEDLGPRSGDGRRGRRKDG